MTIGNDITPILQIADNFPQSANPAKVFTASNNGFHFLRSLLLLPMQCMGMLIRNALKRVRVKKKKCKRIRLKKRNSLLVSFCPYFPFSDLKKRYEEKRTWKKLNERERGSGDVGWKETHTCKEHKLKSAGYSLLKITC